MRIGYAHEETRIFRSQAAVPPSRYGAKTPRPFNRRSSASQTRRQCLCRCGAAESRQGNEDQSFAGLGAGAGYTHGGRARQSLLPAEQGFNRRPQFSREEIRNAEPSLCARIRRWRLGNSTYFPTPFVEDASTSLL